MSSIEALHQGNGSFSDAIHDKALWYDRANPGFGSQGGASSHTIECVMFRIGEERVEKSGFYRSPCM